MNQQFYSIYLKLCGEKSFEEFCVLIAKFGKIMVPAYCGELNYTTDEISYKIYENATVNNISYRSSAQRYWEEEVGNRVEANRIFQSIDTIAALS